MSKGKSDKRVHVRATEKESVADQNAAAGNGASATRNDDRLESNATLTLLNVLGADVTLHELMKAVTGFLQEWSGCEAIGIRLMDGDDFPYFESRGFPKEFVQMENSLCVVDLQGQIRRDAAGNPLLECMCGNILCGRFNSSKPFFTKGGSFWSNCTSELLRNSTDDDRGVRTRNRCNGEGYESVALIPLKASGRAFGLLQLNDRRTGQFSEKLIQQMEQFASTIAMALAHRRAEEALRESESKFRSLFDLMYTGCAMHKMILDKDGTPEDYVTVDVNPEFERLLAAKRDDVVGRRALEVVPNLDKAWIENFGRVAMTGEPWRYVQYASNLDKWFEGIAYSPAKGYFNVTFADVTERMRSEMRALKSESHLNLAQRAARIGSWEWDFQAKKAYWSDEMFHIMQMNKGEFSGGPLEFGKLVHPDDAERYAEWISGLLEDRAGLPGSLEYRILRKDKSLRHLVAEYTMIRDNDGKPLRIIGTVQDVTEKKALEEKAREMERRFRSFTENSPATAVIKNAAGEYLYANRAFEQAFHCEHAAWWGKKDVDLWDQETSARLKANDAKTLSSGLPGIFEEIITHPDGSRHKWLKHKFAFQDHTGTTLLGVIGSDITIQEQMAEELETIERKYESVFHSSPAILTLTTLDEGRYVEVNDTFLRASGFMKREVLGRTGTDLGIWELDSQREAYESQLKTDGKIRDLEARIRGKNGERRTVLVNADIIELGGRGFVLSASIDITERRIAESALLESQAKLHALFRHGPIGIIYGTPDGEIYEANEQACKMLGRSLEELRNGGRNGVIDPNDRLFSAALRRRDEASESRGELLYRRSDGTVFPAEVSTTLFVGPNGEQLAALFFADITDRKRAEQMLHDSEERLRDIIFSLGDWVWEVDVNGAYTYSSQVGFDLFGPSRGDVIGKTPFDLMPPEEASRVRAIFADIAARRAPIKDLENWNITRDGHRRCMLTNGVPILDELGNLKGYRGVDKDITDRILAEQKLQLQLVELQRWQAVTLGREGRVQELKEEVNMLLEKLGQPRRYASVKEL
ncbi:MAG TPA: PAS domain S-box protein [Bacteroidota bacterium]|nr:PAS domain S-box protein [Bacteroidota bacterium]